MKIHSLQHLHEDNGYILLVSVLVTGAIAAGISVALLTFSSAFLQSTQVDQQVAQARALDDACVEEAIMRLEQSVSYAGGATLTLGNGSCTIVSIQGSGASNRVVNVEATVGNVTQRESVTLSAVGYPSTVSSWKRVADLP